ncbi:MAG: DMT family transporter [Puniceicoccales bacterium]|jgi:S-adenosylmethionine uptake transporter|nr:DMT family transporter [Puniceicoccales bacterium]
MLRCVGLFGIGWFFLHLLFCQIGDCGMKFLGKQLHPIQIIFLRFFFATIWLLPLAYKKKMELRTSRPGVHLLRSCLLCAAMLLWCLGLQEATLPMASIIEFSNPLILLFLAKFFLGERITRGKLLVTLIGFLGIVIVAEPTARSFNAAIIPLFSSVLLFASADIVNKKFAGNESMLATLFYAALEIALFMGIPTIFLWRAMSFELWIAAAIIGASANLLFFCIIRCFRLVDASTTAPWRYFEFVLSVGSGYFFFGEKPSISTLVGAAIIIPTTLFLTCGKFRPSKRCCHG